MDNYSKKRTAQLLLCSLLLESCYNPNIGAGKKILPAPADPIYQQHQYEQKPHDKPTSHALTPADDSPIKCTYGHEQGQAVVRSQDQPPATTQPLPTPGREAPSTRPSSWSKPHELLRSQKAAQAQQLSLHPARPVHPPSLTHKAPPGIANQVFQAQGGQQVRFIHQDGPWQARVIERIGAFSRIAALPVVCERHGDIEAALRALQTKPEQYVQRRIHVLPQKGPHPAMVFIGAQGLPGGMDRGGEPSGSGEPQDELLMRRHVGASEREQGQELTALHPGSPPAQSGTIDGDLIDAAEGGHLQGVQRCLSEGANIEARNNRGATPLLIAAGLGHLEVVQYLKEQGANFEATINTGATPLYIAATNGHLEVVQYLKEQGANFEAEENSFGATPLMAAATCGHLEVVKYLKEQGADFKAKENTVGAYPLLMATQQGHLEVVQYLVEQGADFEATDRNGTTPLYIAATNGHPEVVQYLVEQGANIEATTNGKTPLRIAAQDGHLKVVQYLVEQGANIEATDRNGLTPLYIAAGNGHLEVVQYLKDQGADFEAKDNKLSVSPLWIAATNGHLKVVQYLKGQGADFETKDNKLGTYPLWIAAQQGHLEVVQYLKDQGANFEATINDGTTPLWQAAHNGHLAVVQYLVDQGANFEARNNQGATPLMIAEQNNHQEVVAYFRRQDANMLWAKMLDEDNYILLRARLNNNQIRIDEVIEKGGVRRPLLHWACCEGKPNLVAELLYGRAEQRVGNMNDLPGIERAAVSSELVVDTETRDPSGLSPLHHAASAGHLAIVQMLVEYQEILVANSVAPGHPLKYTAYVASLVDYVNRPTRGGQTALQLAKAHHNHEVSAYLKGISKGARYYCISCTQSNPLSKLVCSMPCLGQLGYEVMVTAGADMMPRKRLFNKHRVWSEVREERAQPQPGTSS